MIKRRLKVTLPGSIYKRGRRWWWKVQLPGEPEVKARSLRPEGQRYGVTNLRKAGAVALFMWQLAVEHEAERHAREKARLRAKRRALVWARRVREARQEGEQALAKRQATLEKRIQAYRRQAKSWTRRIRQAKAEVDRAVLVQKNECARRMRACKAFAARAQERAITRIRADANKTIAEQRTQFEKKIRACKRKTTRLWDRRVHQTSAEIQAQDKSQKNHFHRRAEIQKKAPRKAGRKRGARAEKKSELQATLESTALQQVVAEYATANAELRMQSEAELDKIITSIGRIAYCECCFHNGVSEDDLVRIDSGQKLCPSCLKALEEKEAEMDGLNN